MWAGAAACAPIGSPKFGLLSAVNVRLAQWGDTFAGKNEYAIVRRWSAEAAPGSGPFAPLSDAPGARADDLVQALDADVLAVQLERLGDASAPPLLLLVSTAVAARPGAAKRRPLSGTRLHDSVVGVQSLEGDRTAGINQCDSMILSGGGAGLARITLPGGSGQLLALAFNSDWNGGVGFARYNV